MTGGTDELERGVEASRARLEGSLDGLQARLNAPRLSADLDRLRRSGGALGEGVERLAAVARADPLPALLICAGAGFLLYEAVRAGLGRRRFAVVASGADPRGDTHLPENHPDRAHGRLDDALEETFPGSDPISVRITK